MARKLAHTEDAERRRSPGGESGENDEKGALNRREYLVLGASTVAAVVGTGAGVAGASADTVDGSTYTTDFSEYSA